MDRKDKSCGPLGSRQLLVHIAFQGSVSDLSGWEDSQGRLRGEFLSLFILYLRKKPWTEDGSRDGREEETGKEGDSFFQFQT